MCDVLKCNRRCFVRSFVGFEIRFRSKAEETGYEVVRKLTDEDVVRLGGIVEGITC